MYMVFEMVKDYVPTGIPGVDRILAEKGVPRGHTILVSGGPGSGKTTFAIQFLYIGAIQHEEPGVYVTLDEDPKDMRKNMLKFGWDLKKLEEKKKLVFINISPVRVASSEMSGLIQIGMKEFRLIKLLEAIRQGILVNPRGMEPVGAKGVFEVITGKHRGGLSSTTTEHTPWTRQFYSRSTTDPQGEPIEELTAWTERHWEDVVLKPAYGYSGHGIFVGNKTKDREKCIQTALNGGDYIIQELIP